MDSKTESVFMCCDIGMLLLFLCFVIIIETSLGYSNPDGYLFGKFMQYAQCEGTVEAQSAVALNVCLYVGSLGNPYPNSFYIYSPVYTGSVVTSVNANLYFDANCTQLAGTYPQQMNACTTAGSAVYYTYSPTLPDVSISGGFIETTTNSTSSTQRTNCSDGDLVLTTTGIYDGCVFNCISSTGGAVSCKSSGCSGGNALLSYYKDEYCQEFAYSVLLGSVCRDSITCVATSSDDDNDNELTQGELIGTTIVTTAIGVLILEVLLWLGWLWYSRQKKANEQQSLTADAEVGTSGDYHLHT